MPEQPADAVPSHPLAEKLVWPMNLTDVKVMVEGIGADGQIYRMRSASTLEIAKPEHLAFVEVTPILDSRYVLPKPAQHFLTLVGQFVPNEEGNVYVIEILQERAL